MERQISYKNCFTYRGFTLACIVFVLLASCKKYITVDTPATNLDIEAAFKSNTSAAQVITGIYADMAAFVENGGVMSTNVLPELSADNLTLFDPAGSAKLVDYYRNSLEPNYLKSNIADTYWSRFYGFLFRVNISIEQLTDNKYLNTKTQQRLLGEAYFLRAYIYFYLVNFYGEVPLVLTSNYEQNRSLPKNSSDEVYKQVLSDLNISEGMLDYSYTNPEGITTTTNRLRPNKAAVNALQARVLLYTKNYGAAESAVNKVLAQPGFALAALNSTFLANSTETVWALQPVQLGKNTEVGALFLLPAVGPDAFFYPVYASQSLLDSFLPGDGRRNAWFGSVNVGGKTYYYPAKYKRGDLAGSKDIVEYTIVLRVAELFLIRAEARNEQGNITGAVDDINAIRQRSRSVPSIAVPNPLPALLPNFTSEQLRPIILQERRAELFTEWGHRWFDLRRSGFINAVMTAEQQVKGGIWSAYKAYYPIPQYEIDTNPNLVQTPGYNK